MPDPTHGPLGSPLLERETLTAEEVGQVLEGAI